MSLRHARPSAESRGRRRARPRALAAGLAACLAVGLTSATLASPAQGDTAPTDPNDPKTPVTVSADALPTVQINGVVWKQAIVGNTVYAGGSFSNARPAGRAAGSGTVTRNNLLSFNLTTGVLNTNFAPSVNAQVMSVVASPDGRRLYIGGDFSRVGSTTVYRVAAFDLTTGALINAFRPRFNGQVRGITLSPDGSVLYAGGNFTSVNNIGRMRLAAVRTSDGSLTPWAPQADKRVNSLVVSPDGSEVVVGGQFMTINGSNRPGYGLAAVTSDTGALVRPFPVNDLVRNGNNEAAITNLAMDDEYFYGVGWAFGKVQGNFEGAFQAKWSDHSIEWIEDCHGDSYDVYSGNTAVYVVGHPHMCKNIGAFPDTDPRTWHRALAFSRARTGTIARETQGYFNYQGWPSPSLLHWFPDLTTGSYTGQTQGPWTITGNDEYLVLGGEFKRVNETNQQGLVRFAISDIAPDRQGPRRFAAEFQPTVSVSSGDNVTFRWPSNYDRDNRNLNYAVIRTTGGTSTTVHTRAAASTFWQLPTLSFTEFNVPPGQHSYRVTATDPFGNTVTSPSVSVTINAPAARAAGGTPSSTASSTPSPSPSDTATGLP